MNKPKDHHIIGKVYDVTADNMNKIITELDEKNKYIKYLEQQLIREREHAEVFVDGDL